MWNNLLLKDFVCFEKTFDYAIRKSIWIFLISHTKSKCIINDYAFDYPLSPTGDKHHVFSNHLERLINLYLLYDERNVIQQYA